MGSDIAHDDAEEPLGDHPTTDGEEDVEFTLSSTPTDGGRATPPDGGRETSRSEELTVLREAIEAIEDVQTVMNDRIELLGREVDDIWMALREDR